MNTPPRDEIVKIMSEYATPEIAADEILNLIASKMPEKKPKVVKRKGFYPPYQPQVEQHERNGWNAYHDTFKSILKGGMDE
jgi:hypothetical protein